MEMPAENVNLCGKLLIAMPGMGDPRFERSVVYICDHTENGAMGLIVNKPTPEVTFAKLIEQLSIEAGENMPKAPIYFGGPVEIGRGFVLHSTDYCHSDITLAVDDDFGMTATRDVLADLANGSGPKSALLALGYSGWGAGQLENEIRQNGWLTCDATPEVVFNVPNQDKWTAALKLLGVDALMLSATAGHA
ncbi:MAG TPA: YqgE/AlgH family protein [Rhodobacteraceae bacterium]|jgi:putative transcriptional regulator|nr:YqgE/AlgH family protein [Paracoccaceae bacterium]